MNKKNSRTMNVIKGTLFGTGGYLVTYAFSFVTRTIFIHTLGQIYLGVQGLFLNILSLLSLTELGFGSAIMFSLYKPIADNDLEKVKSLMEYFKKAYRLISLIVFILGMLLLPFLDFFMDKQPNIPESLEVIYLLYLINTVTSYMFIYKQSLIKAYQKTHIVTLYNNIFIIVRDVVQIIFLLTLRSFIPILIIQIIFTFLNNITISLRANTMFPIVINTNDYHLDQQTRKDINTKIKSMFLYRIGAYVVNGTDNILISKYIGLVYVGLYSNYYLIVTLVKTITGFLINAMTPSIGNVISTSNLKKVKEVFEELNFVIFWLYSFCSICLYFLINPFITIWLGNDYLLSSIIVIFIVVNFYIYGIHQNMLIFRNALGLYVQAKWKPVLEAIVNLVASLVLMKYFGLAGVIIGTTISFITTALWIEPVVLFKYYLGKGIKKYFYDYILYIMLTVLSVIIINKLIEPLDQPNIITWILKFLICVIVHNLIIIIFFHKTNSFKSSINRFKGIVLKK